MREWRAYAAGDAVLCPGVKLGREERRRQQSLGPRRERREQRPAPHEVTYCRAVFLRVGVGEVYHVRWLGDRWSPITVTSVSTHKCRECGSVFEVAAERLEEVS